MEDAAFNISHLNEPFMQQHVSLPFVFSLVQFGYAMLSRFLNIINS